MFLSFTDHINAENPCKGSKYGHIFNNAISCLNNGKVQDAIKYFSIITRESKHELCQSKALYQIGLAHFEAKRYQDALITFNELIIKLERIKSKSSDIKKLLANAYLYKGFSLCEQEDYTKVEVVCSSLYGQKNYEEVIEVADKVINKLSDKNSRNYNEKKFLAKLYAGKMGTLVNLKKYYEAQTTYNEFIEKNEHNYFDSVNIKDNLSYAFLSNAYILNILEDYEDALIASDEMISKIVEFKNGSDESDLAVFEVYSAYGHIIKGNALFYLGKYEEALYIFDDLIYNDKFKNLSSNTINSILSDALLFKGKVFSKFDMLPAAKECFKKAYKYDSNRLIAYYELVSIYLKEGDINKAKKFSEEILQTDPNFRLAHSILAHIFLKSGSIEKAHEEISLALSCKEETNTLELESSSDSANIYFVAGLIEIEKQVKCKEKKYSKSVEFFERAISFDVENPKYLLSSVYAKYLCQKFENNDEINSNNLSNINVETLSQKNEDLRTSEFFNSIISDLDKVLNFYRLSQIKKIDLYQDIKLSLPFNILFFIFSIFALMTVFVNAASRITMSWKFFEFYIDTIVYLYFVLSWILIFLFFIFISDYLRRLSNVNKHSVTINTLYVISLFPLFILLLIFLQIFFYMDHFEPIIEYAKSLQIIYLIYLCLLPGILFCLYSMLALISPSIPKLSNTYFIRQADSTILFWVNQSLGFRIFKLDWIQKGLNYFLLIIVTNLKDLVPMNFEPLNSKKLKEIKWLIRINTLSAKFKDNKEIREYALYLQGYFYYKIQDYNTAKEKLQECIKLKSNKRINKAAKDLLNNIWKAQKPSFWDYWFNSPIKTWKRKIFGFVVVLCIFIILFVHIENPEIVTLDDSKNRGLLPSQINIYPYIISYTFNNTSSNNIAPNNETFVNSNSIISNNISHDSANKNNYSSSEGNNNTTIWNFIIPAKVNIYPKIPLDNAFDAILLLILIFIFVSPSIRIKETLKFTLNRDVGGQTLGLETQIEPPPEFNIELSPTSMLNMINDLKP